MCLKFRTFWKKKRVNSPNYYGKCCIQKRCLFKRLKGLGSEHHVNGLETLLKLARHHYFPTFPRTREKLSWKMSALITSQIFRLFVNTLTPDDKYSRRYMQIFWKQLQTTWSQKGKTLCGFFNAFLKCAWNLEHSEKKEEYPSLIIT